MSWRYDCVDGMHTGVAYTEDKLLQTRIFSYADTQRHRSVFLVVMPWATAPHVPRMCRSEMYSAGVLAG
jgi:hypothetical protein